MKLFSFFNKKKLPDAGPEPSNQRENAISEFRENDFLGKAAEAGHKAKAAVKAERYDKAWGFYHEQKSYYMQHASRSQFTDMQTLALDASVHERLANILRHERKNQDALVHIVYWVMASSDRPIKRHQQKLKSYFNRCKFNNMTFDDAKESIDSQDKRPVFTLAKSIVSEWADRG